MTSGYYRFPTIHNDTVIFVSEDDLWTVSTTGGLARRLTNHLGDVSYPSISPDGAWVAFVGREEGTAEVYLMPATGGEAVEHAVLGRDLVQMEKLRIKAAGEVTDFGQRQGVAGGMEAAAGDEVFKMQHGVRSVVR